MLTIIRPSALLLLALWGSCAPAHKEPVKEIKRELCRQPFETWAQVCHVDNGHATWFSGRDLTLIQTEETGYHLDGSVWYKDTFWMVETKDTVLWLTDFYSASNAEKVIATHREYRDVSQRNFKNQQLHIQPPQ